MQRIGFPPATKDMEAAPLIWCTGTCVMERIWRERVMIVNVPEWDHFVMGMVGYSPISLHSDVAGVQWHFSTELHHNHSIPRDVRCRVSSTRNAGDRPRTPCHPSIEMTFNGVTSTSCWKAAAGSPIQCCHRQVMVDVVGCGDSGNYREID